MFRHKSRVIVGMTTYYNENLIISMSGMSRLGKNITLIIHNDNPDVKLTRSKIRRMGYKGRLHIINSDYNKGMLDSRLEIIKYATEHKINAEWFLFADDDDIVLNLNIPRLENNHFAIIQNMAVVRTRLVDVLRVINNPDNFTIDNENVYLVRPHIGLAGTLVRTENISQLGEILGYVRQEISNIDESLGFRPPVDMMMWSALNIIARHYDEKTTPIYMDELNYLAIDIDTAQVKYSMQIQPQKNPQQQIMNTLAKYDMAVRNALVTHTTNAAPAGQELNA
ncbi:MAG: hypothetical protein J6R52_02260 [Alphaproteobacteria bacterium]|nr:hypothetical protein [Alphaproteobacteria bacterium]